MVNIKIIHWQNGMEDTMRIMNLQERQKNADYCLSFSNNNNNNTNDMTSRKTFLVVCNKLCRISRHCWCCCGGGGGGHAMAVMKINLKIK